MLLSDGEALDARDFTGMTETVSTGKGSNSLSGSHDNGPRIWGSCACQEANYVFSAPD